jgi:hypothetical protein
LPAIEQPGTAARRPLRPGSPAAPSRVVNVLLAATVAAAAAVFADVWGGSLNPADGTHVVIYTCTAGANQQLWRFDSDGTIRQNASNKCVQPIGGTKSDANDLAVYTCNGSSAQRWVRQQL